jgi:hypothetical protein
VAVTGRRAKLRPSGRGPAMSIASTIPHRVGARGAPPR